MGWVVNPAQGNISGGIPLQSGRYYDSRIESATTTLALAANTQYGVPFYVPVSGTATSINIEVSTLANPSNIRLGIYNDNGGVPGTLVLDAGVVSGATTGGKTIAISQALAAGWYWLSLVSDHAPTVRALSQTNALPWLGFTSNTDTTFHVGWSVAFTYAALPTPFTAGGALMTTAAPRIMLGV